MIRVSGLVKTFGDRNVLAGLDFVVPSATIASIMGPSGCGKTTLLNILAGIDRPDIGTATIIGCGNMLPGYMMQGNSLLPWRTLAQNATLGVEVIHGLNTVSAEDLNGLFTAFGLDGFQQHIPNLASAGMCQRVSLIRTLLLAPKVLLLDEPFSSLDFDVKLRVQRHLLTLQREGGTTILLVTHDIEDAVSLSDVVHVMSDRPTRLKVSMDISLGVSSLDPLERRKSLSFHDTSVRVLKELKYLDPI